MTGLSPERAHARSLHRRRAVLHRRPTAPLRNHQRGYLLVTVVITLFLLASIALLLANDSSISANTSSRELDTARAEYLAQAAMQHAKWRAAENACVGDIAIAQTTIGTDRYEAATTGAAATTTYTVNVSQDAWIRNDDVTGNNGGAADQHVRFEGGNVEQALFQFDVSSLPAGANIYSAEAWFYIAPTGEHPEGAISVREVTRSWSEAGATWDTIGDLSAEPLIAMIPVQATDGTWVRFNITSQVQSWVNGGDNHGVVMTSQAEDVHAKYASREAAPSERPYITVVVGSGPASAVSVQATGTTAGGTSRTLIHGDVQLSQAPGFVILPTNGDGKDGWVDSTQTNDNFGVTGEMTVSGGANPQHFLAQFETASIPAGSRIVSAELEMYLNYMNSADPSGAFSVHAMTEAWSEGTGDDWNPGDGANWNTSDGSNAWSWTSNHEVSNAIATTTVNPSFSGWHSWDIAPLVQSWVNGEQENHGLLVKGNAYAVDAWFRSSDNSDASQHPRLTVSYACQCGFVCAVPGGSGKIGMFVANPYSPNSADSEKKALLESWGYEVDLWDDDTLQFFFDLWFKDYDLAYVSESSDPDKIGSMLTPLTIGVVNEEPFLNDELGIASGSSWLVGRETSVVEASHYITSVFPAGQLAIFGADMEGVATSGEAPGALRLAEWGGGGSVVSLDAGATKAGGGSAAGRRVSLPFGRQPNVNFDYVNANGLLLMQRAIAWGMGGDAGNLLLVVGISDALSDKDKERRDLFKSWGYSVTIIDDGASQAEFTAALAANDVVYVAGSVVDGSLDDKLAESVDGIVNEVGGQLDDLGFHGNATANTVTADSFDATDAAHYISEPFAGSGITHFTRSITMPVASAPLAPSLGTVASIGVLTGAIPVLATGAERWDGLASAGRRVHLPFGNAKITELTADGITLMRRAIEWAAGAGCDTVKPLLILVADAANPTPEELARQSLLQGWCYSVSMTTASEPQATYDAFADSYDVLYVPASVNYADVTSKLKLQPVGIVNEVSTLSAYLGFTSGTSGYTGSQIDLIDDAHYITAGLTLGNLAVTTSPTSLRTFVNSMGPGFQTLATRPSFTYPMIMTLEEGAELLWGGNAPDRRVMLPWGGSSNFDVNGLTADGQGILRRALEWAASEPPAPVPLAHWKMDDASGTTAVDSVGGHDGTLTNGPAWAPGNLDGALDFDGSNDYVDVPHDDGLSLSETMSFTAWVNASSYGSGYQTILAKDGGGAVSNYWFGTWQRELVFGFYAGGLFREVFTSGLNLQAGTWYHVGATFDDSANTVRLYVDGVEVENGILGFSPSAVNADLGIGRSPDGEFWRGLLDDVRIYDQLLPEAAMASLFDNGAGGGGGGGGGSGCDATFRDEFNNESYDNNDGSESWSTSWQEINESDGWDSGDERVDDNDSDYHLQIRDNDGGGEGVQREADLSGYTTATLSFDYRRDGFDNSNDYVMVHVSGNGGGSWTELDRFTGPGTDSSYVSRSYDISSHISANSRIRFLTSPNLGGGDEMYIDNVEITASGCASP